MKSGCTRAGSDRCKDEFEQPYMADLKRFLMT